MKNSSAKIITQAAIIAALYVVLTLLSNALGLANLQVQFRLSEALTILPALFPAAIPGLFIGCILANIFTGALLPDIIAGSLATLVAAILTYKLRKSKYLAVLPPIICNTIVIPIVLRLAYGIGPLAISFLAIFASEVLSAGVGGILLYNAIIKKRDYM